MRNSASPQATKRATYNTVTCSDTLYVQVNVHFVQTDDGKGNFRRFDDGHPCRPDTAWTGYRYAQELLYYANLDQGRNPRFTSRHD